MSNKGFFSIVLLFVVLALFFFLFFYTQSQNNFVLDDSPRFLALKQEEAFSLLDRQITQEIYDFANKNNFSAISKEDLESNYKFNYCDATKQDFAKKQIDENTLDLNISYKIKCSLQNQSNDIKYEKEFLFMREVKKENNTILLYDLDNPTGKYLQKS